MSFFNNKMMSKDTGDSLAGNMAGQIIGIACGSVGTPLKDHERRGRTQQHNMSKDTSFL